MPLNARAATADGAVYVYDEETGNRTGIESMIIDDVVYYDMQQGRGDLSAVNGNESEFFKQVLIGEAKGNLSNENYDGTTNMLTQWAEIAEKLFSDNAKYSSEINASGSFDQNFGKRWGEAGYTDVSKALASKNPGSWGSKSSDRTVISGLQYASSLSMVRQNAAKEIVDQIDVNALDDEYADDKDTFFSHNAGDNALGCLKDDSRQDVYYTMATCIDNQKGSYAYHYNDFILAFYDFKLVPLASNNIPYITAIEGYEDVEQAAAEGAPGASFYRDKTDGIKTNYFKNGTRENNTVSMNFDESNSETVSNSFESSESYSFSETVGFEVEMGKAVKKKLSTSFTAGQVFSTSTGESESISKSTSTGVSSSITLPPHTAAKIETSSGNTSSELKYSCPVGISYKVAICSLSGKLYADRAWTMSFSTAGYHQRCFQTVFGSDSVRGGKTARENIRKRAVDNVYDSGFDQSYGNTYGYYHCMGGSTEEIHKIDWNKFLDGIIDIGEETATIDVKYMEVDNSGKMTGRELKSYEYGTRAHYNYETAITTANPDVFEYVDPYGNEPAPVQYHLWTGAVKDEEGNDVDNAFSSSGTKAITPVKDVDNNVVFYYWTDMPEEEPEIVVPEKENTGSEITPYKETLGVVIPQNRILSRDDMKNFVKWLSTHEVLSYTGANIKVDEKYTNTIVGDIVPIYDLDFVDLDNNLMFGDYSIKAEDGRYVLSEFTDGYDLLDFEMNPGDKLLTRELSLKGYDRYIVDYYGFRPAYGTWKEVVEDDNGKWKLDTTGSTDSVAKIYKDRVSGFPCIEAGDETGTVYFQYFIDEDRYISLESEEYIKNEDIDRPVLKINVRAEKFEGNILTGGKYRGRVNHDPENLSEHISITLQEEDGKEVLRPVKWEQKELNGLKVTSDGQISFTKEGTYHVRAIVDDVKSEWIEVRAEAEEKLVELEVKSTEINDEITPENESVAFDLKALLKGEDQYGDEWLKDIPGLRFSVDNTEGAAIDNGRITIREPGQYIVTVQAEGFEPDPITINIKDHRKYVVDIDDSAIKDVSVSLSETAVEKGGSTVATVTPDKDMAFEEAPSITVSGADVGEAKKNDDGSYSFEISGIESDITIRVTGSTVPVPESITVSGDFTGVVSDGEKNIEEFLDVKVYNASGKVISKNFTWEAEPAEGIILSGRLVRFSKEGNYRVRAVVNGTDIVSDWKTISAENARLSISSASAKINAGATKSLTAEIMPSTAEKKNISWKSGDTDIARVSSEGIVTGIGKGTATITATDDYGNAKTCKVTVINPVIIAKALKSSSSASISWNKVKGADGYDVYGTRCYTTAKKIKTVKGTSLKVSSISGKKLSKNSYKFAVKAYMMVDGKKVYLATSKYAHVRMKNTAKYSNAKSISISQTSISLSKGKSKTIRPTVSMPSGKKQMTHVSKIRYVTSDNSVATVSSSGKITAKAKGTCYVYALSVNGRSDKVKITVK